MLLLIWPAASYLGFQYPLLVVILRMFRSEQSSDNPLLAMAFLSIFQIQRFEQQLQKPFCCAIVKAWKSLVCKTGKGEGSSADREGGRGPWWGIQKGRGDVWGSRRALVLCPWIMPMAWWGPLHPHLLADVSHSSIAVHCKCICKEMWDIGPLKAPQQGPFPMQQGKLRTGVSDGNESGQSQ